MCTTAEFGNLHAHVALQLHAHVALELHAHVTFQLRTLVALQLHHLHSQSQGEQCEDMTHVGGGVVQDTTRGTATAGGVERKNWTRDRAMVLMEVGTGTTGVVTGKDSVRRRGRPRISETLRDVDFLGAGGRSRKKSLRRTLIPILREIRASSLLSRCFHTIKT